MKDAKEYAKKLIDHLNDGQTEITIDFLSSFFNSETIAEREKEIADIAEKEET